MIGIDDFHLETPTKDNNAFEKEYLAVFDQTKPAVLLLNEGHDKWMLETNTQICCTHDLWCNIQTHQEYRCAMIQVLVTRLLSMYTYASAATCQIMKQLISSILNECQTD